MRFSEYINLSCDDKEINKLRLFDVKLVKKPSKNRKIVEKIEKKYNTGIDVINLIDELNGNLRKVYKGNMLFDFCIKEGKVLDDIKLHRKKVKKLKLKYYDLKDDLSKVKTFVERIIKEQE